MNDRQLIRFVAEFRHGILDGGESRMQRPRPQHHYWLKLKDGRALDPTADQFNDVFGKSRPAVYLGQPIPELHGAKVPA